MEQEQQKHKQQQDDKEKENNLPENDSILDITNAISNDSSNSLEPGEVVEDNVDELNSTIDSGGGDDGGGGNKFIDNTKDDFDDNKDDGRVCSPNQKYNILNALKKPVLGREKAKQRLKALCIQKKIQMQSKNLSAVIQKRKKSRDKFTPTSKKGKPPTPHEKAKLTKEAIEKMKEKPDCKIPCLYYDAAMIHHIRTECPEEVLSRKFEPSCLTASSLEALKNYDDHRDNEGGVIGCNPNNIYPVPGTSEGSSNNNRDNSITRLENSNKRYRNNNNNICDDNVRNNFKQTRRKLFYGGQDNNTFLSRGGGIGSYDNRNRKRFFPMNRGAASFRNFTQRPENNRDRRRLIEQNIIKSPKKLLGPVKELPPSREDGIM